MTKHRQRGVALGASALVALAAACASPQVDPAPPRASSGENEEPVTGAKLPGAPAETDGGLPPAEAGPDNSAVTKLCGEPDLALCFAFEGDSKESSKNAATPSDIRDVTFTAGKAGQAAQLSATSSLRYVTSPQLGGAVTIEAWVKPSQRLESVVFDADERFAMLALGDSSLACVSRGDTVRGGVIALDAWSHVACVYDGHEVKGYINGFLINTGHGNTGGNPRGAAIGGNSPTGSPFVGAIDSFRVFNVARTPEQIKTAAGI